MVKTVNKTFLFIQPLLFPDKKLVVIAYESSVEVHDYNRNIIWTFQESSKIIKLEINDDHQYKFYVAYENGEIKICDIMKKSQKNIMHIEKDLKSIFVYNDDILTVEKNFINFYKKCDINQKKQITDKVFENVAFSKKSGIIAMVEKASLSVICLNKDKKLFHNFNKFRKGASFTCIAVHPSEPIVATGTSSGQIIIWWDVLTMLKRHTIIHWHFLTLKSLAFNYNGSYLLSGGCEHVLVKWEVNATEGQNRKSFLPHLESDIESIRSCNDEIGEHYLVTLSDNSYRIINTNMKCINTYMGIVQRSQFLQNKISKKVPLNPIGIKSCGNLWKNFQHSVIMNGHEGKLQFFDLVKGFTHCQLDVACQNWPTETENHLIPGFIQVKAMVTSKCGQRLAAYESRAVNEDKFQCDTNLKIFHWNDKTKSFEMEVVHNLDYIENVTDMVFHPTDANKLIVVANSMQLLLFTRSVLHNVASWTLSNIVVLEEKLIEYHIVIDTKSTSPAKLATISCPGSEGDGILIVTKSTVVVMFRLSSLFDVHSDLTTVVKVDTLSEDLNLTAEQKSKLNSPILSTALFRNQDSDAVYRLVLGLQSGLMVVELSDFTDCSVEINVVSGATSPYAVKSLECCPGVDKVAILFGNSDKLTILDVWKQGPTASLMLKTPRLDAVTWVPVPDRDDWTLVGLFRDNDKRSVMIIDDSVTGCFTEVVKTDPLVEGRNLLEMNEDLDDSPEITPAKRRCVGVLSRDIVQYAARSGARSQMKYCYRDMS